MQASGRVYINANQLKEISGREPRLLAKIDSLRDLPKPFHDLGWNILPVQNGNYLLFQDSKNQSFVDLASIFDDLKPQIFNSQKDLSGFDSLPFENPSSESQALDICHASGLLDHFCNTNDSMLTIRGRAFSGLFDFKLDGSPLQVNQVQIEIDAGYENSRQIILLEAKMGRREDFHLRQLYYPWLAWKKRSSKVIVPIFLMYSNQQYFLCQFRFNEYFGNLEIVRKACYVIAQYPFASVSLKSLLEQKDHKDPKDSWVHRQTIQISGELNSQITKRKLTEASPFPQANDLDKVCDVLLLLSHRDHSSAEIANYFDMDRRQGDYYANATLYLGLSLKKGIQYSLSESGWNWIKCRGRSQRIDFMLQTMVKRPLLKLSLQMLLENDFRVDQMDEAKLTERIRQLTQLGETTARRRVSTLKSWCLWVHRNLGLPDQTPQNHGHEQLSLFV